MTGNSWGKEGRIGIVKTPKAGRGVFQSLNTVLMSMDVGVKVIGNWKPLLSLEFISAVG